MSNNVTKLPGVDETLQRVVKQLGDWRIQDRLLPAGVSPGALTAAHEQAKARLVPATKEQVAVAIAEIFDFARTFGFRDFDAKAATKFYQRAFAPLPADLLAMAVKKTCDEWRYGNRLPTPGDILGHASARLTARRREFSTVEAALRFGEPQQGPKGVA